jgi:hypothetical protein
MFYRCLKGELWKAFHNKRFYVAFLITFVIQMMNVCYNIYYVNYVVTTSAVGADVRYAISLFARWISAEGFNLSYDLLRELFPLLCIMPFGWSFLSEQQSGYEAQLLCRIPKTTRFVTKYIAVFLSGAAVIGANLLVNFLLNSLFLPSPMIDPFHMYMISPLTTNSLFVTLFYSHPWLFCGLWLILSSLWGGLLASTSALTSLIFRKNIYVLVLPFLILLAMLTLGIPSPLNYLLIYTELITSYTVMAELLILFFVIPFLGGLLLRRRREVL